jgi:hypothetical protein
LREPSLIWFGAEIASASKLARRNFMVASLKSCLARLALACIAIGLVSGTASAITVELARTCNALVAQAFPPRQLGNPAAGSEKGSGRQMQDYFKKCVENQGKMPESGKSEPGK